MLAGRAGVRRYAAVGSATRWPWRRRACKRRSCRQEFSGAELAAKLSPVIFGTSVLLPRSDRATEELPSLLRKAGANVTEVIAYRTVGPEASDRQPDRGDTRAGRLTRLTFFSPSAFREFQNLVGADLLGETQFAVGVCGGWTCDGRSDSRGGPAGGDRSSGGNHGVAGSGAGALFFGGSK